MQVTIDLTPADIKLIRSMCWLNLFKTAHEACENPDPNFFNEDEIEKYLNCAHELDDLMHPIEAIRTRLVEAIAQAKLGAKT